MVTNLAIAIVTLLFNKIMLKYMGENGVAAITIVLYAQFLLTSIFMGFSSGIAPVFSYNYGNNNKVQIKKIIQNEHRYHFCLSLAMFLIAILFATLSFLYLQVPTVKYLRLLHGFFLFSISYLFTGMNIFSSSMFTAFSNGKSIRNAIF